jgi:hypothetical protein
MKRIWMAAALVGFAGLVLLPIGEAQAQTALPTAKETAASRPVISKPSVQRRSRRPVARLLVYPNFVPGGDGVYPHFYPGPNAVRECSATYEREFRPSGTVIVPRMSCYWRPG